MIERVYGDKDAHLASAAENQILIFSSPGKVDLGKTVTITLTLPDTS
jgi:hypothetical protein